ncbi:sulfide/dihydroorotate dehydrogenase-like FAD/NAD-binding protein [Thermotalea metallivorans]|uniref:Dihydroorotate dehydrogenase B (NAD(+)), electron transfer subunit n=1 Tax=Thermotalea metallivorans TaxID=520762 RepID=A0A140L8G4_9FIRM|nr:sulfide/dihydroorotate dehydrogenase-like FAD/NAD-binding protein [Thermotalea metallivorans]KXG76839.1 hypothetical protein AN619_08310 [Thermotalea metallivorans]
MGQKNIVTCIDAGSEYCPCYLAENNECITCSHLQGKSFCDCNWSGVCIYQEFSWCGNMKKNPRETIESKIIEKKQFGENVFVFKFHVSKTLARQLKQPGSYIFVRDMEKPLYFDVPMSIMYADEQRGEIHIAVQILGVKTKALLDCQEKMFIKGPYWNGLIGLKDLKGTEDKDVLVVGRGIALAPAMLAVEYLLHHHNRITFVIDPGKTGSAFIEDYFNGLEMDKVYLNLRTEEGLKQLSHLFRQKSYSLVYSGGSDLLHQSLKDLIAKSDENIKLVATNNHEICCGEGVCGSCTAHTINGKRIKMCKAQVDVEEIIERGNIHG